MVSRIEVDRRNVGWTEAIRLILLSAYAAVHHWASIKHGPVVLDSHAITAQNESFLVNDWLVAN